MEHHATDGFWRAYDELPLEIRKRADRQFRVLKGNPQHPSLQLKKIGVVTLNYRALALKRSKGFL